MRNFQLLAVGIDVIPILHQITTQDYLWNANSLRTTHPGSAHAQADDIWIRFNDLLVSDTAEKIVNDLEAVWYPAINDLPAARPLIYDIARRVEADRIGRVLITRLAPGQSVSPHSDDGANAEYYDRYHLVLHGLPGNKFRCGDETVDMETGALWWFRHGVEHECRNESMDDRIHMILDFRISR